jgi:hypothetical protein
MAHSPGRDTEQQYTSINAKHTNHDSINYSRSFIQRSGSTSATAECNTTSDAAAEYAFTKRNSAGFAFTSCTFTGFTNTVRTNTIRSCGTIVAIVNFTGRK